MPTFDVMVLGPPDLLITALVAALSADGVVAARMPVRDAVRDGGSFPLRASGVLVVDVDVHNPAPVILRATRAGVTVLVIGLEENRERAAAAIAAGAVGWIRKTSPVDALTGAVREALAGRMQLTEEQRATWLAEHRSAHDAVREQVGRLEQLSPREREVLRLLADGLRATEISGLLFLSITTVRSHIRKILRKLGVNSQQQAVDEYRETTDRLARILGTRPLTVRQRPGHLQRRVTLHEGPAPEDRIDGVDRRDRQRGQVRQGLLADPAIGLAERASQQVGHVLPGLSGPHRVPAPHPVYVHSAGDLPPHSRSLPQAAHNRHTDTPTFCLQFRADRHHPPWSTRESGSQDHETSG